jgi:hypothetical protein
MPNEGLPYILHHIDQLGRVVRSNQSSCDDCVYYAEDVKVKPFNTVSCRHVRPLTANLQPDGTEALWCINGAFEFIKENDNVCDS